MWANSNGHGYDLGLGDMCIIFLPYYSIFSQILKINRKTLFVLVNTFKLLPITYHQQKMNKVGFNIDSFMSCYFLDPMHK
jgi:hypothetical protein